MLPCNGFWHPYLRDTVRWRGPQERRSRHDCPCQRRRSTVRKTVVGLAAAALVAAAGAIAGPAVAATTTQTVALWDMNEAPGSTVLVDSSGHGLNGTIGTSIALNGADQTFP